MRDGLEDRSTVLKPPRSSFSASASVWSKPYSAALPQRAPHSGAADLRPARRARPLMRLDEDDHSVSVVGTARGETAMS